MASRLRLHFSHKARHDLTTIWEYTFQTHGLGQAERYTDKIEQTCQILCDMPLVAPKMAALSPEVRIKITGEHIIAYETRGDVLFVIRILHTRSDWQGLLFD